MIAIRLRGKHYKGQPYLNYLFATELEKVLRPKDAKGFVLIPQRWVVEFSF